MMSKDTLCALEYLINIYYDIDFSSSEGEIINSVIKHAYTDATNQGAFNTREKIIRDHDREIRSYVKDNKEKSEFKTNVDLIKEKAVNEIKKALDNYGKDSTDFNSWHADLCSKILDQFKKVLWVDKDQKCNDDRKAFTYGNAQKWVNMTIKNIYVLCLMGRLVNENNPDVLGTGFHGFMKKYKILCDLSEDFHFPVDSYIIDAACSEDLVTEHDLQDEKYKKANGSCPKGPLKEKTNPSDYIKGWSQWDKKTYEDFIGRVKERHKGDIFAWENEAWIKAKKARQAKSKGKN